jgi:cysteine-rich repeat protein
MTVNVEQSCGNGIINAGEQCDDGQDGNNTNLCKDNCTWNICGDGIKLAQPYNFGDEIVFEHCDDGNGIDDDGCPTSCKYDS